MRNSRLSIGLFALYMSVMALAFIIVPNSLITLFGFAETSEIWVRILGYMVGAIAFFYAMALRAGLAEFYQWTIYARLPILPLYMLFVYLQLAPPVLLLFGAIDLGGALWTWHALRMEKALASSGSS